MAETKICDACGRMICANHKSGTVQKNMGSASSSKHVLCQFCIEAVLKFIDAIRADNKERFDKLNEILLPTDDQFKL